MSTKHNSIRLSCVGLELAIKLDPATVTDCFCNLSDAFEACLSLVIADLLLLACVCLLKTEKLSSSFFFFLKDFRNIHFSVHALLI